MLARRPSTCLESDARGMKISDENEPGNVRREPSFQGLEAVSNLCLMNRLSRTRNGCMAFTVSTRNEGHGSARKGLCSICMLQRMQPHRNVRFASVRLPPLFGALDRCAADLHLHSTAPHTTKYATGLPAAGVFRPLTYQRHVCIVTRVLLRSENDQSSARTSSEK